MIAILYRYSRSLCYHAGYHEADDDADHHQDNHADPQQSFGRLHFLLLLLQAVVARLRLLESGDGLRIVLRGGLELQDFRLLLRDLLVLLRDLLALILSPLVDGFEDLRLLLVLPGERLDLLGLLLAKRLQLAHLLFELLGLLLELLDLLLELLGLILEPFDLTLSLQELLAILYEVIGVTLLSLVVCLPRLCHLCLNIHQIALQSLDTRRGLLELPPLLLELSVEVLDLRGQLGALLRQLLVLLALLAELLLVGIYTAGVSARQFVVLGLQLADLLELSIQLFHLLPARFRLPLDCLRLLLALLHLLL